MRIKLRDGTAVNLECARLKERGSTVAMAHVQSKGRRPAA